MEWLSLTTGLIAAGISIPALVILYFLKLKRQNQPVSSTLLWKKAIQDLQVNAPFQKLRRNILLLLQLIALIIILVALAGPVLKSSSGPGKRYVLLIDKSASMSAVDVKPSRLDEAKRLAGIFIDSIRSSSAFSLSDNGDQVMVIAFDGNSKVMSNFTSDKKQLKTAVDAIEIGHGPSKIKNAVTVGQAFAMTFDEDANNRSDKDRPQLILFSDGNIQDLDSISISTGELIYNKIGNSDNNLAITSLQARRSYENPDQVDIFAAISNYNGTEIESDLQLSINENIQSIKSVSIPGISKSRDNDELLPGKTTIQFTVQHPGPGVIELLLLRDDDLHCDNKAWNILAPPRQLNLLLVTEGNPVLASALKACNIAGLEIVKPAEFDSMDHAAMSFNSRYDLIVMDNHTPENMPTSKYIIFGRPPGGIDVVVTAQLEAQTIIDWRQQHSIMKYVNPSNLFAVKCFQMDLPRDADVLAEFNEGPAIALLRRNGSDHLLVGFNILESNWPFEPGFILFCYNAVSYMATQSGLGQDTNVLTQEPIIIDGLPVETEAVVNGPDIDDLKLSTGTSGTIRLPSTDKAGIYTVQGETVPVMAYAVNVMNSDESSIKPLDEITVSGQQVQSEDSGQKKTNVPLWPWLVLFALVMVCTEWWVYNSKLQLG